MLDHHADRPDMTRSLRLRDAAVGLVAAGILLLPGAGAHAGAEPASHWSPRPLDQSVIRFDWDAGPDRRWGGPRFRPNRLQDWRVSGDRVWCTESREDRPVRTLMSIGVQVAAPTVRGPAESVLEISVRSGVALAEAAGRVDGERTGGFRGLLFGAGGADVHPLITGLVHHRPGPRGGTLAVVDGTGQPAFRDFDTAAAGGSRWTMGGRLAPGEAVGRPGVQVTPGPAADAGAISAALDLVLTVGRTPNGTFSAWLESRLPSGSVVGTAVLNGLGPGEVDGAFGLVSHGGGGARGGEAVWFDDLQVAAPELTDTGLRFGPVVSTHYVVSRSDIHLTVQAVPLDDGPPPVVELLVGEDSEPMARAALDADAWAATLRISRADLARRTGRPPGADVPFRVRFAAADRARVAPAIHGAEAATDAATDAATGAATDATAWRGTIRGEPGPGRPVVVASLNCQKSWTGVRRWDEGGVWYPHAEVVAGLAARDPDLLVFSGDQLYEGDVSGAQRTPADGAILDYLDKWFRFCMSFAPVTAHRPTVTLPDDHDVYHGNIWGAGGRAARADRERGLTAQDSGGYVMPPRFVNVVHATQVGHLPPHATEPIGMGIRPWTSRIDWGGLSLALVADRMFKSAPSLTLPEAKVRNGWSRSDTWDPATEADAPGAELLGPMQEAFLEDWAGDFSGGVWAKIAVSGTPFVNVATLPPGGRDGSAAAQAAMPEPGFRPRDWTLAADMDSGAWPPAARDRAVAALRTGGAVHLCGDQHLGVLLQYGTDGPRDAGFAFCSPAIANTWPRRWYPPEDGADRVAGAPGWTGDFRDAFGHPLTVWAVANPARSGREPAALHDAMPGWGAAVFDPRAGTATFECWPRWAIPGARGAVQYAGWPRTVSVMTDGRGRSGWALPPIVVESVSDPVVRVLDTAGGVVAAARLVAGGRLPVPGRGPWTLEVGEPGTDLWRRLERIVADPSDADPAPFFVRWE